MRSPDDIQDLAHNLKEFPLLMLLGHRCGELTGHSKVGDGCIDKWADGRMVDGQMGGWVYGCMER